MNNQEPTEREQVPSFINFDFEKYNKLLRELDKDEKSKFNTTELAVELNLPEIVTETIKLIAALFYRIPVKRYLVHCVVSNVLGDFDRLLRHHTCYEKLFDLIKDLDDGRD